MSLTSEIERLIEEEVNRRVNAKVTAIISYIASRWDISILQVSKDVARFGEVKVEQCLGRGKAKNRCKNRAKENGFCHLHQSLAPKAASDTSVNELKHTHTLPPLYLAGCPACDRIKNYTGPQENESV